ncbi:MAG: hypothetical protein U1A27_03600 [Phycisphaerae bacterium]
MNAGERFQQVSRRLMGALAAGAVCVLCGAARGQTPLPKGLHLETGEETNPAVEAAGQVLARRYREALTGAVKFGSESMVAELSVELAKIAFDNARFEADTRHDRVAFAAEIRSLEQRPDLRSAYQQMRVKFVFGQFEQIMTNAPLEPSQLFRRLLPFFSDDQRMAAWRAILKARGRFVEVASVPPLDQIWPGTPDSRAAFCVARYDTFLRAGLFEPAGPLPEEVEPLDSIAVLLPEYPRPSPPIVEWRAYGSSVAREHGFTTSQWASMRQVVSDCAGRAENYTAVMHDDYQAVLEFKDERQRKAQRYELDRGVFVEFAQLQARLAGLILPVQRPTSTAPAASQPAVKYAPPRPS